MMARTCNGTRTCVGFVKSDCGIHSIMIHKCVYVNTWKGILINGLLWQGVFGGIFCFVIPLCVLFSQ